MIPINDIVAASHFFVRRRIGAGDTVVDATAGNGNDTLFLAQAVGPGGRVHAFDIQSPALARTHARLAEHGLEQQVILHQDSHKNMAEYMTGPVQAVMFNLGYLPGGDKRIITSAAGTGAALAAALALLAPRGLISIVTYSGHGGGADEQQAVAAWCAGLCPDRYNILCLKAVNQKRSAPELWLVQG